MERMRGLLKASIRDDDPVEFLENEMIYGLNMSAPGHIMDKDLQLLLDKARVKGKSTDVAITAFSKMVGLSLETPEMLQKAHNLRIIHLLVRRPTCNQ